jgi:hypothetical protein
MWNLSGGLCVLIVAEDKKPGLVRRLWSHNTWLLIKRGKENTMGTKHRRVGLWIVGTVAALLALLLGCASRSPAKSESYGARAPEEVVVEREMAVDEAAAPAAAPLPSGDASVPTANQVERKIIYTVSMELIVKDTETAFEEVGRIAQEMGGFVSESNMWRDQEYRRASVTIRVPVERLDESLDTLRALAVDIESTNIDSQDVTEDYVDLAARLTNEQRTEAELLELLKTRSETGKTSDILEVHRELSQVRSQIEQIQGKMKYLENMSAMATVRIALTPDALLQPVTVGKWQPQGTARDAIRMLLRTLQFLADVAIVFVLFILPVLIVIAIPLGALILGVRALWRRAKRRKAAKKAAE